MSGSTPGVLFRCKYCHFIFETAKALVEHKKLDHADEILQIVSVTGNYRSVTKPLISTVFVRLQIFNFYYIPLFSANHN